MANQKTGMSLFQKILILASGGFFLVSTGSGLLGMFNNDQQTNQAQISQQNGKNQVLEQQAMGYEKVLEKEPKNQFALDGLIKTRVEMNDLDGLQAQMERLIKLYPDEPSFQEVMKAIEQDRKANSQPQPTPNKQNQ